MAKYLVTNSSYFEPFTYDELAKPIIQTVEAHNAAQDAYDAISMETAALAQYLSQNKDDEEARKLYNDYMQRLVSLQNNLWERGYNAGTRKDLSSARTSYFQDMGQLKNAIERRQKESAAYYEAKRKNRDAVMGRDPGSYGLDYYLHDQNFGKDWYSYDSAQFEKDVSNEIKTRAQAIYNGLTDANGIVRNPVLKQTMTRVINHGVTSEEVDAAGALVDDLINMPEKDRENYYKEHPEVSPVVQMLTEVLINRYDATGIRDYEVSDSEKQRLINRGKSGLAGGIMAPQIQDFEDPEYKLQMALREYQGKADIDVETARRKAADIAAQQDNAPLAPIDTDTDRHPGDNYGVARKRYDKEFPKLPRTIITSEGQQVDTKEKAAEIVYSGELRRSYYKKLGIDVGRDPNSLTSSGYITGVTTGADGQEYEIQYNPKAKLSGDSERGGIRYRPVGSKTDWSSCPYSKKWTEEYREGRKKYEERLAWYKQNEDEKELYKAAKGMDPDKQHEIYERDNIGFMTPLTDYASVHFDRPDNNPNAVFNKHYVAQNGTDAGKLTLRLSGYLSNHLGFDGGKPVDDKEIKTYHNTSRGIHKVSKSGGLSQDAVQAGDAFRFDEDGNITNVKGVIVTPESILDLSNDGAIGSGYIILNTSKGLFSVNVDMFDSDRISSLFVEKQQRMLRAMSNPNFSDNDLMMEFSDIADDLCRDIQKLIGIDLTTKSTTGTAGKEDK